MEPRLPSTIRAITSRTSYGIRRVGGHDAVELGRVDGRLLGRRDVPRARAARGPRVPTIDRTIRSACASSSARWSATPETRACTSPPPSSSARDDLAGGGLHQRRAAEEDRALVADDHGLVAHRRDVGAAGGARAHHRGDLRDAGARTSAPGCRRSGRSARGRGRPRPASGRNAPPESTR